MAGQQDVVQFQAEHHPMEGENRFASLEGYSLYLMHLTAYERIAAMASGNTVLDLGCNNGWGTRVIAQRAVRVVGVDVSEMSLAEAKRLYCAPNIEYRRVDGLRLPFEDHEFDVVASCQVIEHVADYRPYLGEIVRVLKPGGVAIFTTPNACIRLDPGMEPWFPFHVREFSGAELHELLQPLFARVEVAGLFAIEELYEVEFRRVQRSRDQARRRSKAILPPYVVLRARVIDAVKSVLPNVVIRHVQEAMRKGNVASPTAPSLDAATRQRYSTADYHYSSERIDEALDLMAVCQTHQRA